MPPEGDRVTAIGICKKFNKDRSSGSRDQRYAHGQTDSHTDRQKSWSQYSAPLTGAE